MQAAIPWASEEHTERLGEYKLDQYKSNGTRIRTHLANLCAQAPSKAGEMQTRCVRRAKEAKEGREEKEGTRELAGSVASLGIQRVAAPKPNPKAKAKEE